MASPRLKPNMSDMGDQPVKPPNAPVKPLFEKKETAADRIKRYQRENGIKPPTRAEMLERLIDPPHPALAETYFKKNYTPPSVSPPPPVKSASTSPISLRTYFSYLFFLKPFSRFI